VRRRMTAKKEVKKRRPQMGQNNEQGLDSTKRRGTDQSIKEFHEKRLRA
jgi:hypothetical protein